MFASCQNAAFLHVFVHISKPNLVSIIVEADCWVNVQQYGLILSTLLPRNLGCEVDQPCGLLVDFRSLSVIIQPLAVSVCLISSID